MEFFTFEREGAGPLGEVRSACVGERTVLEATDGALWIDGVRHVVRFNGLPIDSWTLVRIDKECLYLGLPREVLEYKYRFVRRLALEADVTCASSIVDSKLAVGDANGGVSVAGGGKGTAHQSEVTAVEIVGQLVVSGAYGSVKVWTLDLHLVRELRVGLCTPSRLKPVSGKDSLLVVAAREGSLAVWTTEPRLASLNDDTTEPLVDLVYEQHLVALDARGWLRTYALDLATGQAVLKHERRDPLALTASGLRRDGTFYEAPVVEPPPPVVEEEPLQDEPEEAPTEEEESPEEEEEEEPPEPRVSIPLAAARPKPPKTELVCPSRTTSTSQYAVPERYVDETRTIETAPLPEPPTPTLEPAVVGLGPVEAPVPARTRLVPKQVDQKWLERLETLRPRAADFEIPDACPQSRFKLPPRSLRLTELPLVDFAGPNRKPY